MIRLLGQLIFWCSVLAPWMFSLYLHFWLDQSQTWSPDKPLRGMFSVMLLGLGMALSFVTFSYLSIRGEN
ncbi:MAG: hypothetical protein HOM95_04380 [Halieaceae bacterium]|nr:hypothetical protein [Halieaceae bacterium]